ncbi:MAG: phosphate transport system permease protein [Rhodospirillaceae bacterium]|nr:MAG: phosphate transport system permease protein [Rhodospirillaceae bacterium]
MSKDVIISNNEIPFPPACAPERLRARLRHRHAAERRFRLYGLAAVGPALMMLVLLFVAIVAKGYPAFRENVITLTIPLTPATIDPEGRRDPQTLAAADYQGLVKAAMASLFPAVAGRTKRRLLFDLVSTGASYQLPIRRKPTAGSRTSRSPG